MTTPTKTHEDHFRDWESHAFGFGYGTGERHVLAALKDLFAAWGDDGRPYSYDYKKLESAVTPTVAWLFINALCRHDVDAIEYGISPRYGWLTDHGQRLKAFVDRKSADELYEICGGYTEDYVHCYPDACNCGPNGYEAGRKCANPFWGDR